MLLDWYAKGSRNLLTRKQYEREQKRQLIERYDRVANIIEHLKASGTVDEAQLRDVNNAFIN